MEESTLTRIELAERIEELCAVIDELDETNAPAWDRIQREVQLGHLVRDNMETVLEALAQLELPPQELAGI